MKWKMPISILWLCLFPNSSLVGPTATSAECNIGMYHVWWILQMNIESIIFFNQWHPSFVNEFHSWASEDGCNWQTGPEYKADYFSMNVLSFFDKTKQWNMQKHKHGFFCFSLYLFLALFSLHFLKSVSQCAIYKFRDFFLCVFDFTKATILQKNNSVFCLWKTLALI